MISHGKKFIFIHVPKTGGNSITENIAVDSEDTYFDNVLHNGVMLTEVKNDLHPNLTKHSSLAEYREAYPEATDYLVFGVRRNPWDRAMSHFLFARPPEQVSEAEFLAFLPQEFRPMEMFAPLGEIRWLDFDRLDEEFHKLVLETDWNANPRLTRVNAGTNSPALLPWSCRMVQEVATICQAEIAFFKYSAPKEIP